MKKIGLLFPVFALALVAVSCSRLQRPPAKMEGENTATTTDQTSNTEAEHALEIIRITEAGFDPKEMTIKAGASVKFINEGKRSHWPAGGVHSRHDITYDAKRPLDPGESIVFTFDKPMELSFHDHFSDKNTVLVKVVE